MMYLSVTSESYGNTNLWTVAVTWYGERLLFRWMNFIFSYWKFIANHDLVPKSSCSLASLASVSSSVTSIITTCPSCCYLGMQQFHTYVKHCVLNFNVPAGVSC